METDTYFCDHCGKPEVPEQMYHYGRLPFNIDSANKGESGSICGECQEHLSPKTGV